MTTTLDSPPQAATFDLGDYLARFDADALVRSADYRRAVSRVDPLAFALTYLPHHLRGEETGARITLSEFHLDLIGQATRWIVPDTEPAANRDAYVAPDTLRRHAMTAAGASSTPAERRFAPRPTNYHCASPSYGTR